MKRQHPCLMPRRLRSRHDQPQVAARLAQRSRLCSKSKGKEPYPDWKPGTPVPYAALCQTFSLIEMTTKRLIINGALLAVPSPSHASDP